MIRQDFSLRNYNSFRLDIKAKTFFQYSSVDELKEFFVSNKNSDEPLFHIGGGNNLLFRGDFCGTILFSRIQYIEEIRKDNNHIWLKVGSGVEFDALVADMCKKGIGGLENLSLIPSQVGAAAVQNIGAYGAEIKDVIEAVEVFDPKNCSITIIDKSKCGYGYRHSNFKSPDWARLIVTSVIFKLDINPQINLSYSALKKEFENIEAPTIKNIRDAVIRIRRSKLPDPKELGNAGSFFKNPYCTKRKLEELQSQFGNVPFYEVSESEVKIPAAWLIEQCGFKGKRFGNVGAYDKQPLVLVNYGNATSQELIGLSERITKEVYQKFGLTISPEVIFV